MSDNGRRVLNLDEVFGQDRPVKVLWQGREYELLRLEAFSPREVMKFGQLQERANKLAISGERLASPTPDPSPNGGQTPQFGEGGGSDEEIEALFDEMLSALCKELPLADMPFLAKTRIITFYIEETQGKKALEEALMKPPIGATSLAG